MLNIKELKKKYINKNWFNSNNEIITIKDIVEFNGIGLYKIAFQKGFHEPIEYLHDISDIELTDFLNDLKSNKKVIDDIPIEQNKPVKKEKNDLEKLKDILFLTLNDLLDDEVDCNKANTVSKMAQTIINLEKINSKIN
jgi:hypothetical protein